MVCSLQHLKSEDFEPQSNVSGADDSKANMSKQTQNTSNIGQCNQFGSVFFHECSKVAWAIRVALAGQ